MAVRANLLEMNDLQNAIEHRKKEMETLRLFEANQCITAEEQKQLVEERRKTQMYLQDQMTQLSALERENVSQTIILLALFMCAMLVHFGRYVYWLVTSALQETADEFKHAFASESESEDL